MKTFLEATKRRFGITLSSYRKRFLNAEVLPNELQSDFIARNQKLFLNWLKRVGCEQTFEDVFEHVVLDRYLASQDKDLKIYLEGKGKLKLPELAKLAQCYLDAREPEYRLNDRGQSNSEASKHKKLESKHKPEFNFHNFDSNKSTQNDIDKTKGGTYKEGWPQDF
jgi:SCAN domain